MQAQEIIIWPKTISQGLVCEIHVGYALEWVQTKSSRPHLFIKHSSQGKTTTFIVYMDDIILTRDSLEKMQKLKGYLSRKFEIKDLGALEYFLGD